MKPPPTLSIHWTRLRTSTRNRAVATADCARWNASLRLSSRSSLRAVSGFLSRSGHRRGSLTDHVTIAADVTAAARWRRRATWVSHATRVQRSGDGTLFPDRRFPTHGGSQMPILLILILLLLLGALPTWPYSHEGG